MTDFPDPQPNTAMYRVLLAMRNEPDRIFSDKETAEIAETGFAPEQAVSNLYARGFVERVSPRHYRLAKKP